MSSLSSHVQEEHQLSQTTHVKDSGQGFIQVPLPETKQLIGIKFKRAEMAAIFLGKIREQMSKTNTPKGSLEWSIVCGSDSEPAMSTMKTADNSFPPTKLSLSLSLSLSLFPDINGPVTMQAVVIDDKPASDVPNPEKLPRKSYPPHSAFPNMYTGLFTLLYLFSPAAIGYGGGPTTLQRATRTPAPPPAQDTVVEATDTHPGPQPPASNGGLL